MLIPRIKSLILKNRLMSLNLLAGGVLSAYCYAAGLRSPEGYYSGLLRGVLSTEGLIIILFLTFKILKSIRIETGSREMLRLLPGILINKTPLLLANLLAALTASGFLFLAYLQTGRLYYLDLIEKVVVVEGLILCVYLSLKLLKTWTSETDLKEKEEKLKLFTELTEEAILIREGETVVEVNDVLARMLGYRPDEMIGENIFKFMSPQSAEKNKEWMKKGYPSDRFELAGKRKDGTTVPILIHGRNIIYKGRPMRLSCGWDVTEFKKMEEATAKSEERFKRFAGVTREGILVHRQGVVVDVNQALSDMLGMRPEDFVGKDSLFFLEEKSAEEVRKFRAGLIPEAPYEIFIRHANGTLIQAETFATDILWRGEEMRAVCIWNTTERKKMEKALAESQERFRRFAEVAKEGIEIHDHGVIVDANQALADMLGVTVEEMIGKNISDFSDAKTNEYATPFIKKGEGLPANPSEITLRRKDGTFFPTEVYGAGFKLNGRDLRVVSLWDITNRKKMEEALRQSEEGFRNLVEKSPDAIFFHSDNKITYANESMADLLGYAGGDELIGGGPLSFLHPDDMTEVKKRMNHLKKPGDYNEPREERFIRKDGSVVFVEVVSFSVMFKGVLVMVVVSRDLTERKKAEEAVVESQERFRRFSEVSREGILIHENGIIIDANQAAADMTGYAPEEAIGRQVTEFLEADSAKIAMKYLQEGTFGKGVELKLIRKDKKVIPVEATGVGLNVKGRNLRITSLWDLTSRKEMEEALRKSEHSFRNLIEKSPDAIIIHAHDQTVYVNQAMLSLLGYSRAEDLIGKIPTFFVHPEDVVTVKMRINKLKNSGDYNPPQEKRFVRKDGTVLFVDVVSFLTYFEGAPMTVAVARDLTGRKQSEEALMKLERLSTIGEMAAGMAHEIRNPLAAISTAAQILKRRKIKENTEPVETILEQSGRLEKLIRDTLDYAKTSVGPILKSFSVQSALESALNLSQIQFGPSHKKIKVSWDLPDQEVLLQADSGRIQQILVNLILNAFQIVGEDGAIKLGLKSDNQFVFIRVEDNGPGVSEANMKRIFEPFFTTKDRGSGLGLAISQRIAQEHGGQITVERVEPRGTAFTLQLLLIGELEK